MARERGKDLIFSAEDGILYKENHSCFGPFPERRGVGDGGFPRGGRRLPRRGKKEDQRFMEKRRLLASILVLMMLFTLLPAGAATAFAEDGEETPELVPAEAEAVNEPEESEAAEPEALPVTEELEDDENDGTYPLWICGEQVTDSNKNKILNSFGLVFDPDTATLTIKPQIGSTLVNHELYNDADAVIYSELPDLVINITATSLTIQSDAAKELIFAKGNLTLIKNGSALVTLSSTSAEYGIFVADGDLKINCYVKITTPAADCGIFVQNGDLLLDKVIVVTGAGNEERVPVVLFESVQNGVGISNGTIIGTSGLAKSTLSINGKNYGFNEPTFRDGSVTNAVVITDDDVSIEGPVAINAYSAEYGVYAPNGAVKTDGTLKVTLLNSNGVEPTCIYAENGLAAKGDLSLSTNYCEDQQDTFCIRTRSGPVYVDGDIEIGGTDYGIYCGAGDVTVTGRVSLMLGSEATESPLGPASGIYTVDGGVNVAAIGLDAGYISWLICANGPVLVGSDLDLENKDSLFEDCGGGGIKSTEGGIVIKGSASTSTGVYPGFDSGNAPEGITIEGDLTLSNTGNRGSLKALGGPVHVTGDLTAVKVTGEYPIESGGNFTVDGNVTINRTSIVNPVNTTPKRVENIIKSDGKLTIGGSLASTGGAAVGFYGKDGITVEKDVTITNGLADSVGMYSDGEITFVSGKWDVTAKAAAIQAKGGIVIPAGYGVTLPEGGMVAQVDERFTVTEADGETVAVHAIIEEKEEATVTVFFDAGAGSVEPESLEVPVGGSIETLPEPVLEGWVFLGWFLEEPPESGVTVGQGTRVTEETTFDENTTVYAHWRLPGDVNGDGQVNTADVALLAKYVKARGQGVTIVMGSGNINGGEDGEVNTADVALLAKYVKARGQGVTIY